MARLKQSDSVPNFFGIGIYNVSNEVNIGTLWRSAYVLGASFIFTIGRKYEQQGSDVYQTWTQIPLYNYATVEDLKANLPYSTQLIGVEISDQAQPLIEFEHPDRAAYLLGSEMYGLPEPVLELCHRQVILPGNLSLNVAATGSIVLYDRISKIPTQLPKP